MHMVAGFLLVVQFVLLWVLDASVDIAGLEVAAWAVWLGAAALLASAMLTLRKRGRVQEGKSFVDTKAVVATGVYALVRHPLYLGWALMYLAVVLFETNWLLAVIGIAGAVCVYRFTVQEDALLVAKFGEPYRRYMHLVPRFNLPAGVIRLLLRRWAEHPGSQ